MRTPVHRRCAYPGAQQDTKCGQRWCLCEWALTHFPITHINPPVIHTSSPGVIHVSILVIPRKNSSFHRIHNSDDDDDS